MKKFIGWSIILSLLFSCRNNQEATLEVWIEGKTEKEAVVLVMGERTYQLELDSAGYTALCPDIPNRAALGKLKCGKFYLPLYLEPSVGLSVYMNLSTSGPGAEFRGEGAFKNELLNGKYFSLEAAPDFSRTGEEIVEKLKENMNRVRYQLDSLSTDSCFKELVLSQLKYKVFKFLASGSYKTVQKADSASGLYKEYIKSCIEEVSHSGKPEEYRKLLPGLVTAYVTGGKETKNAFPLLREQLKYVEEECGERKLTELLTDEFVTAYVGRYGIDSLAFIDSVYQAEVKDPVLRTEFKKLCQSWAKIQCGMPAPEWRGWDKDSVEIRTGDLKGKYVYAGFWTTGSKAAEKEMIYFREMEKRYKKKNICFVGIACQPDRQAWKDFIEQEKIGGVQLQQGENAGFLKEYKVQEFPRFILLDPSGCIVSAEMPFPSDSRTEIFLKKVL